MRHSETPSNMMSTPLSPGAQHLSIDPRDGFFHAMLSYRVSSDQDFGSKLHDKLHLLAGSSTLLGDTHDATPLDSSPYPSAFHRDESTINSSIRIFQDVYCLRDGMGWEGDGDIKNGGFIGALRLSVVFVPLFSVVLDKNGLVISPGEGSVGQLLQLSNLDKQDNVLLELIIGRELHILSKNCRKNTIFPCSYILPLFRNKEVWKTVSQLPNTPSAFTNSKALHVMEQLGIPLSAVSIELRTGTLTVKSVLDFFAQFQGIKLYDCGKESLQISTAARAILRVVHESMRDLNFQDMDVNFASMYELSDFMSQLNMAHYTVVLAAHGITNVGHLAQLNFNGSDATMQSIAKQCTRASGNYTVHNELIKLRSAVAVAAQSPFGRPLNERFQEFIDHDASFVTMLSSSSLFDIALSKSLSRIVIAFGLLCMIGYNIFGLFSYNPSGFFPNNRSLAVLHNSATLIPHVIALLACPMSVIKSPRTGRFFVATALFLWAILYTFDFAISAYSAIYSDCVDCALQPKGLKYVTILHQILLQPINFIVFWAGFFCAMFKQQHTVNACILLLIFTGFPSVVFVIQVAAQGVQFSLINGLNALNAFIFWTSAFVFLKILQFIGNRRAQSIFDLNSDVANASYSKLCVSYPKVAAFARHNNPSSSNLWQNMFKALRMQDFFCTRVRQHPPRIADINFIMQEENFGNMELFQQHSSFEGLIQDAEFLNVAFQEWVSSWLSCGPNLDNIQKFLYQSADGIDPSLVSLSSKNQALPIFGFHIRGPVKHIDRSIQKV
jgi:hypothetical protein